MRAGLIVLVGAIAALISACSPLRVLNALVPSDTYSATRDLAYGPNPRHKIDVYQPRTGTQSPVVVFFYGGSWNRGEREDYKFVAEALAASGIVVALADYRLYPEVRYPEFLEDGARAVAWVRREARRFGADPEKLFVMGHSAGAYNAAMLALWARPAPTLLSIRSAIRAGWRGGCAPPVSRSR